MENKDKQIEKLHEKVIEREKARKTFLDAFYNQVRKPEETSNAIINEKYEKFMNAYIDVAAFMDFDHKDVQEEAKKFVCNIEYMHITGYIYPVCSQYTLNTETNTSTTDTAKKIATVFKDMPKTGGKLRLTKYEPQKLLGK